MNRERLQQMVTMLRGLPPEKFDIAVWHCGTTACAVGHACLNKEFRQQGLALGPCDWNGEMVPAYGEHRSWDAVSQFFEIPEEDAIYLFSFLEYRKPGAHDSSDVRASDVADRIESFLKEAEVTA